MLFPKLITTLGLLALSIASPAFGDEKQVDFFGLVSEGRDVVFVIEGDGSIISDFVSMVTAMEESLMNLTDKQRYGVVVFDGEGAKVERPRGLQRARKRTRERTLAWLRNPDSLVRSGSGDVVPALRRAAAFRPDVIFLAAQNLYNPGPGDYENQRTRILDAIDQLRLDGTPIFTIEINQRDPLAVEGRVSLLHEIAMKTGGQYRFIQTTTDGQMVAATDLTPVEKNVDRRLWVYEAGWFEKTNGETWVEVSRNILSDGSSLKFREVNRTAGFVELYDQSRKTTVRLEDTKAEWRLDGEEVWNFLYEGGWREKK